MSKSFFLLSKKKYFLFFVGASVFMPVDITAFGAFEEIWTFSGQAKTERAAKALDQVFSVAFSIDEKSGSPRRICDMASA
jgi:hypothetical protein